ncbi:MAG: GIY-YIG nuclease family protein [Alphaproteobacteria bacterium]|jgi:excinuclease UvrABC nuclease subunit|nr:GIY-YIG nuclease family protein [Alphaproteobacteria bacterium]
MTNIPSLPGAYILENSGRPIYIGSTENLFRRINEWRNNPENPCVRRMGFDNVSYRATSGLEEARRLELHWFNHFRPVCNLATPPGTA